MSKTRMECGVPSERGFVILIFSAGWARVVMPLTGGGVAMGERGGGWRESIGKFDYERPVRKVGMVFALG